MSRQVVKTNGAGSRHQVPLQTSLNLQKYSQTTLPQVREVNVPMVHKDHSIITSYRDLDQPARDFALHQKRQLIIGVFTFVVLGIGIMMGQHFSGKGNVAAQNRGIASESMGKLIPADANIRSSVQYEKTCFTESNGAEVCNTRVSTKR